MLEYNLIENLLTATPDDHAAQVVNVRSYSDEQIAEHMLKSGAGLTKSDILSVLQAYGEAVCALIAEGNAVDTALFVARPSIAGVFAGANDSYDPARHHIKQNLHAGVAIRSAIAKIQPHKVRVLEPVPLITQVRDAVSGSVNDHLTLDSVAELSGSRLKLIASDAANGVFLVGAAGEVKLSTVVSNKPTQLIVMVPASVTRGEYHLEVRSTWSGNAKPALTLKVGRFHRPITVAASA
ncbi:MAG: DUF4469 domain-containing protein [Prevotellaceae bacterium]|jgi:hypothetical protein|nr:DUF4469 domain-containing protein [Prevotellaceae bacterium]